MIINLELLKGYDFRKIGAISLIVMLFSSILGFAVVPNVIKSKIKNVGKAATEEVISNYNCLFHSFVQGLMLKPGSEIRKLWTKVPFPVDFKIYVFNVTNPDAVMRGQIPHVQQIGPYMFE